MKAPQHDRADEVENERELTGDVANAVRDFAIEEQGYHKTLKPRQIQMIAIGGAIGTGSQLNRMLALADRPSPEGAAVRPPGIYAPGS